MEVEADGGLEAGRIRRRNEADVRQEEGRHGQAGILDFSD